MNDIASLSNSLDSTAKLLRVMEKEGVTSDQLFLPVNNRSARRNLAEFLKAGCPKVSVPTKLDVVAGVSPADFERNEHGHVVFTITGLDLTGAEEVDRLIAAKFRISDYAKSCLTSTKSDGYDAKHRLVAGEKCRIVLVPGKELKQNRTTKNLQAHAATFGYGKSLAGIVPRIREIVSDEQMAEWGVWYVAALHDPITGSGGYPGVLVAGRHDVGLWVYAVWDNLDGGWGGGGLFAVVLPASES